MMDILLATRNSHKVAEIKGIMAGDFRIFSQLDFPGAPAVAEDAETFAGNAAKKADGFALWLGSNLPSAQTQRPYFVLADDSGLEVDALEGAPHVVQQQHLGGDRDVGLELGPPVSRRMLQAEQRAGRALDRGAEVRRGGAVADAIRRRRRDAQSASCGGVDRRGGVDRPRRVSRSILGFACRRPS